MTIAIIETDFVVPKPKLRRVLCIQYLAQFRQNLVEALINSDKKVNAMQSSLAKILGFRICKTNVNVQKIDGSRLETFGMVITPFLVEDKNERSYFFEGTFLLANISMDVACRMSFFILSNVKINFIDQELKWRSYTIAKILPTT